MNPAVFRQSAIDKMAQPARPDEALSVTRPRDWLALLAIGLLLAVAGYWGEQGRISTKADAQGVLVLAGGVVNVFSESSGRVLSVRIKAGEMVRKDQVIGSVAQPALEEKLKTLLDTRADLERERLRVRDSRGEGLRLQNEALGNQKSNSMRDIADAQQQVRLIEEQIQVEEELLSKGLITKQQVLTTRQRKATAENGIAQAQAQIKQLESNRFQSEMQATQADRDTAARIAEIDRTVQTMGRELSNATAVKSAFDGKVIEVKVYPGGLVTAGEPFASLEPGAERIEVIVYVPASRAKEVKAGMAAEIVPVSVKREEFGFMRARVSSIAEFPATRTAMMRNFENDALVAALAATGPVHEARIELETDAKSSSGFKWSSSQGPPLRISSGTLCSASIVTRSQRPIELVVPFLKKKLGG